MDLATSSSPGPSGSGTIPLPPSSSTLPPTSRPHHRKGGRPISPSLKSFAMRCVDANLLSVAQCSQLGAFSLSTGNRLRLEWLENNRSLGPPKLGHLAGRPRSISAEATQAIRDMLQRQEDLTLKDIQRGLVTLGFGSFSLSLLSRQLKRMGLSRKEVVKMRLEAAEPQGALESSQNGSVAKPKPQAKSKAKAKTKTQGEKVVDRSQSGQEHQVESTRE